MAFLFINVESGWLSSDKGEKTALFLCHVVF